MPALGSKHFSGEFDTNFSLSFPQLLEGECKPLSGWFAGKKVPKICRIRQDCTNWINCCYRTWSIIWFVSVTAREGKLLGQSFCIYISESFSSSISFLLSYLFSTSALLSSPSQSWAPGSSPAQLPPFLWMSAAPQFFRAPQIDIDICLLQGNHYPQVQFLHQRRAATHDCQWNHHHGHLLSLWTTKLAPLCFPFLLFIIFPLW